VNRKFQQIKQERISLQLTFKHFSMMDQSQVFHFRKDSLME
jgi:hypothetical protein